MTNVKMDYAAAAKTVQNDSKLLGRFFLKLGPPGPGCWMWEGYKNDKGYGQFSWRIGMLTPVFVTPVRPNS